MLEPRVGAQDLAQEAILRAYDAKHNPWDPSKQPLEEFLKGIIKRLTADNAAAIGLNDRGLLRSGMKADLNILDYDALRLRSPEIVYDLPAGGKRLVQRTEGFGATIVSGEVVYRQGEATGALPGRLVRG